MEVKFFDDSVEKLLQHLQVATRAKAVRTIELLERFGPTLGMPHSKKIHHRLFELRVRGREDVRIIYTFYHGAVILLYGFVKKSEKMPPRELDIVQHRLRMLDSL